MEALSKTRVLLITANILCSFCQADPAEEALQLVNSGEKVVDLSNWDLGSIDVIRRLEEALKKNTAAETLNLSDNNIDDEGASIIMDALLYSETNMPDKNLKVLILTNNFLTNSCKEKVIDVMVKCSKLSCLDLRGNFIGQHFIEDVLKTTRKQKILWICPDKGGLFEKLPIQVQKEVPSPEDSCCRSDVLFEEDDGRLDAREEKMQDKKITQQKKLSSLEKRQSRFP